MLKAGIDRLPLQNGGCGPDQISTGFDVMHASHLLDNSPGKPIGHQLELAILEYKGLNGLTLPRKDPFVSVTVESKNLGVLSATKAGKKALLQS